jgi:hypothetical protein
VRVDDRDVLAHGAGGFFSSVFLDTTRLLAAKAGAGSLAGLAEENRRRRQHLEPEGARCGAEAGLDQRECVAVANRDEGVNALQSGSVDAFASDKILLIGTAPKVKDPAQYELLQDDLGFEPYAIVLPRGDAAFRLAVNRALGQIFMSDAIVGIFRSTFGADFSPSPPLLVMYGLGAYPE